MRSIDIANELGFSKPSVSVAMKNLRENGYITVSPEGSDKIYERHTLITDLLIMLGVNPEVAAEDACRIEHVISEESFAAIKAHAKKNVPRLLDK